MKTYRSSAEGTARWRMKSLLPLVTNRFSISGLVSTQARKLPTALLPDILIRTERRACIGRPAAETSISARYPRITPCSSSACTRSATFAGGTPTATANSALLCRAWFCSSFSSARSSSSKITTDLRTWIRLTESSRSWEHGGVSFRLNGRDQQILTLLRRPWYGYRWVIHADRDVIMILCVKVCGLCKREIRSSMCQVTPGTTELTHQAVSDQTPLRSKTRPPFSRIIALLGDSRHQFLACHHRSLSPSHIRLAGSL